MFNCSNSSNFTSPLLLRVLLVDDDFTHLCMVEQILHSLGHQVAKLHSPEAALVALQTNNYMFDIVVSGASISDFGGLKLVQFAGLELDIPVVLMTLDSSHEVAIRGIVNGASKCLVKPIQFENLKNIWQIVLSKQRNQFAQSFCSPQIQAPVSINSAGPSSEIIRSPATAIAAAACGGGPSCSRPKSNLKKREDPITSKKPRLVWTHEPHQTFVDAVKKLEYGRVVPTKILDYMRKNGFSNITRENVASHLQKYRLYVKKLENEVYRSSKLSSQSCLNLTNGENLSFPPNQTLSIKNNTSCSCSTPNLPLDETLFLDQNMEIGWDILLHEGMPTTDFQNMNNASKISHENDIRATGHPLPQQIVPLGEEKNMFSMDLCPPTLSNQMFNVDGNIPIKSDSQDLNNEESFCLKILEDHEMMYLNDYGNGSL